MENSDFLMYSVFLKKFSQFHGDYGKECSGYALQ